MHRSRFLTILLVCTAVAILCIPGAASAHGPDAGSGSGGSEYGGSSPGGITGADSPASSADPGFSSPAHESGAGTREPGPAAETAPGPGKEETGSGLTEPGESSGDSGPHQAGFVKDEGSPVSGQGTGSYQVSGDSGDSPPPSSGFSEQHGSAENPESDHEGAWPGSGGPDTGAGSGEAATRTAVRNPNDDNGSGQAGRMGTPAGIIAVSAAGGMMRGSDSMTFPVQGDGGAGAAAREGTPRPSRELPRDHAQKSLPPETPATLEQEARPEGSRSRGKREEEQYGEQKTSSCAPSTQVPDAGPGKTFGLLLSLFGFRRIRKKNVLENESRKAVFQAIADAPGMDAVALSRSLEMNINTLRYHLAKLLATDKITYLSRPGAVRYYRNQGMFSPFEQVFLYYLNAGTAGRIIGLVSETPGISRKDLAAILGISGPSVTRHIRELSSEGIIRNEPDGRANHYFLTKEAALHLARLRALPTGVADSVSQAPV